ncbi:MAG: co-chaperone GroES [Victivallales bacterium]|jgi:chaperonin 10 Kd subunit
MSTVKIQPLGDRVLVQAIEVAEQVKGGILIPDSAKEKPQEAKVVALGTGKLDDKGNKIPFDVKVGDIVLTSKYGGTEVKYDDQDYKILSSSDILAVIG